MKPDGTRVPAPWREARILPVHLPPDALSIVVFGPGRGESIVVVFPDKSVGVVDGCREPTHEVSGRGDPVREFLDDWAKAQGGKLRLRFVCLTHPHDDHYAGLGRLLGAYRGEVDSVWTVLHVGDQYAKPLLKFVETTRAGRDLLPDGATVKGLERVLAEFNAAYKPKPEGGGSEPILLQKGMPLFREDMGGRPFIISACGPAGQDILSAHNELINGLKELAENEEHRTRFDPNAVSGALLIRWGRAGVLLGGDLLCAQGRYCGWDGVHGAVESPVQVVKVAHHASKEAHHDALWERLGTDLALAIVTPFKKAKGSMPPRPEQISQLAQDTVVAITSEPEWEKDPTNPLPLRLLAGTGKTRARGVTSARNPVLKLSASPGPADIHNAVAVSLDATGKLVRFVLAGKADIYEPPDP